MKISFIIPMATCATNNIAAINHNKATANHSLTAFNINHALAFIYLVLTKIQSKSGANVGSYTNPLINSR